jgi:hypothetical protein
VEGTVRVGNSPGFTVQLNVGFVQALPLTGGDLKAAIANDALGRLARVAPSLRG